MESNNVKSHILSIIVIFLGTLGCIYPSYTNWGLNTLRGQLPILLMGFVLIVSFCVVCSKLKTEFKLRIMVFSHVCCSLFVSMAVGNNTLLFPILSVGQILLLITFDKKILNFQLIAFEVFAIIMLLTGDRIITNSLIISSYVFCMFALFLQNTMFGYIISSFLEKVHSEHELIQTSRDLVKVVDAKCNDAQAATKSKSAFLANMSHEIRTPINAVLGLNEMVLRESKEQDILGYAHDIKSAGTTLLNIINDVLDFSKIESGKIEIIPVSYDISSMLNDLVNMINIKATDKGLSFKLSVDANLPRILVGDEVRLKQVITNILTNAVKYTETGFVKLEVGFDKIDDCSIMLDVTIMDTGIGMREEDIKKLFSPFERIEESRNRNIEGTGLGMAITKTFLHLMGTQLNVNSTYGEGSAFHFSVRQEVEDWEAMGNYEEAFKRIKNKTDGYNPSLYAPDAHILVVDDMPMNISVFKGLLKQTKIQIDDVNSGKACIEKCKVNKYDMIFLDHMMPDMDGIETHDRIINSEDTAINHDTPVIILTANAVSGARDKYMSHGFSDYMTKPIDPEKLEKELIRYLPQDRVQILDNADDSEIVISEEDQNTLNELRQISKINVDEGIINAGGIENYISLAKEFYLTIESRHDMLNNYYIEKDWKNYTIQVHALKSSLRLMGFLNLSEEARKLEEAGNAEDIEYIGDHTSSFQADFLEIKDLFANILELKSDKKDLPILDNTSLAEMLMVIRDAASDFDYDLIHTIVRGMDEYQLPESFLPEYEKLKTHLAEVDFDGIIDVLDSCQNVTV